MVQIRVLSGKAAGTSVIVSQFPAIIGRSPSAAMVLEDSGIWEEHLQITLDPNVGLMVSAFPDALARIDGKRFEQVRLRNGDVIEIGSAQLQLWLSEVPQRSLRAREVLTWIGLALVCAIQVAVIYLLSD